MSRVAGRYAKSLMDLAIEKEKLSTVVSDIQALATAVKNKDLALMLKSPIIHADKKVAIVNAIFAKGFDEVTMGFVRLCISKGREPLLPEIATEFLADYKRLQGITEVKLTTAAPLSTAAVDAIKAKLMGASSTAKNVEISTAVNPNLIGGFVVEFGDKLYDASVAAKLADLKKEFTGNLYESKIEQHGTA
jgi:F-type H+-transporting ATPase subunit delta